MRALPSLPSLSSKAHTDLVFLFIIQRRHIEGALDLPSLESLPVDLFDDMGSLTFLYLGVHPKLRRLPSFDGLVNLRTLTFVLLLELEEMLALTSLTKLEHLPLPIVPIIDSFPDMMPVSGLVEFVITHNARLCCNGFLDECNLSKKACYWIRRGKYHRRPVCPTIALTRWQPRSHARCLPGSPTPSAPTRWRCSSGRRNTRLKTPSRKEYLTEDAIAQCNGTLYRECDVPSNNRSDVCYSLRMMVIACASELLPVEMRKRQIAERVGDPCGPVHEAWLGCPASESPAVRQSKLVVDSFVQLEGWQPWTRAFNGPAADEANKVRVVGMTWTCV